MKRLRRGIGIPGAVLLPFAVAQVSAPAQKSGAQVRGVFLVQASDTVDGEKVPRQHERRAQQARWIVGHSAGGVRQE